MDTQGKNPPASRASDVAPHSRAASVTGFQLSSMIAALGGVQFLTMGLYLARAKVLALLLSPHGMGVVGVIDQIVQLVVQISALSLYGAPLKFVSRVLHEGTLAVGKTYQALLKLLSATTLIGALGAFVFIALRADVLGDGLVPFRGAALVAVLTVPGMALTGLFVSILASVGRVSASALYGLMLTLASVVAAYLGVRLGGISGLYYANLLVGLLGVAGAIAYLWLALGLPPHTSGLQVRRELQRHRDIVSFSVVSYVLAFAQPLSFLAVRYAVLEHRGLVEAGFLQAALAISSVASLILTQSIRIYLWPAANRSPSKAEKFKSANDFLGAGAMFAVLVALPVILFPREATGLLYSSEFDAIGSILYLFVISDYLLFCTMVYQTVAVGVDDLKNYFLTALLSHFIVAALSWLVVPRYGLWGVAWAFIVGRLLLLVLTSAFLGRKHGLTMPAEQAAIITGGVFLLSLLGIVFHGSEASTVSNLAIRVGLLIVVFSVGFSLLAGWRPATISNRP